MKTLVLLLALAALAHATKVRPCDGGRKYESSEVEISNCSDPPCRLRQKTKVGITIKLKPEEDVPKLQNSVFAMVLGVPLPFVGVDSTDASPNVFNPDGSQAKFPLKAGQDYVYKNEFDILPVYPKIKVDVNWALTDGGILFPKNYHCFKVQSKITA